MVCFVMYKVVLCRREIAHRSLKVQYARLPDSRLIAGCLTAHARYRLMLLGSPPDMVHGFTLRETDSSTLLTGG